MWRDRRRWLAASVLLAALAAAAPARAQTFGAVADTFVSSDDAALNFGTFTFAEVALSGPPKNDIRRALLQFDVSTLPAGAAIGRATLRLFISDTSSDPLGLDVTVSSLAASFDELTVTWNTQPAVAPGPTAMGTMNTPPGNVFEIDVTPLVRAQQGDNPGDVWLRIAASDESATDSVFFDFYTKEFESGDQRAQLLIELGAPAPAPLLSGTALLVGIGLLVATGLLSLRHRPPRTNEP